MAVQVPYIGTGRFLGGMACCVFAFLSNYCDRFADLATDSIRSRGICACRGWQIPNVYIVAFVFFAG